LEFILQPRVKILLAYLFILSLGLAISVTIFITGRQVTDVTTTLIEEKLPRLQVINELYLAIIERERLLYEYYATTDSENILPKLIEIDQRFSAYFRQIEITFPHSDDIENIRYGDGLVRSLTKRLDDNFQQDQVDWDSARSQLAELSNTGRRILPSLESLVAQINQEAFQSGEDTRQSTELSTRLVISFSIFVIIIAAFVGYYVNRYITETISRRRLAMFAERSPNPIISFSWDGQLTYSNPACLQLMSRQGDHSQRVESLLPETFQDSLLTLQKSKNNYSQWVSQITDDCILQFSLSLLRDLDTCHLYIEDITERTQAQSQLKYEAYHDILTELPNRRYFNEFLNELVANNNQHKPFALMLIHIDRFDLVTSSEGFKTGDSLMRAVAKQLQVFCQSYCSLDLGSRLYRLDSNKFSLLLDHLPEHDFAENLAKELRLNLGHSICVEGKEFHLTLSIGISHYPAQGIEGEALLANADAALTRIKTDGGDGILCYSEDIHAKEQAWIAIERDLRNAIEKQQLQLFYQPKIQACQHNISGVEALIRWRKDDGKMISPFEFIPVAEQTGLIITIGDWVIDQAFNQLKYWQQHFIRKNIEIDNNFSIAINLSAKQFQHPDFISNIEQRLLSTEIDPKFIELEITESLLIGDIDNSIRIMHRLKDIGFKLSIDDFGTGYSSLSYLKQFPIDKLKIDRAFVMDIESNKDDKVLAKTIVDLAHNLNLTIVAEGVENQQQLEIIETLGAEEIQGFYFSKPKPATEIEDEYFKK